MQINLKQNEIVEALKQYVSSQGINLTGKEIGIAFTAGRKESGISAEITIDDTSIPDFFAGEATPPALQVVHTTSTAAASSSGNTVDAAPAEEEKAAEPEVNPAPVKTASLFS